MVVYVYVHDGRIEPWRWRLLIAAILGPFAAVVARQISFIAERVIGSYLAAGSISALSYGFQLVVGAATILSTGMVTPLIPLLAQQRAAGDKLMFVRQGFHYLVGIALPFSVGFYLLARPAVLVLFHGNVGRASSIETVSIVKMYALGIVFNVLAQHFQSLPWAERRYRTLIVHNALIGVVNILLDLMLVPELGAVGLALGFSLASLASVARMYWILHHEYGAIFKGFRELQVFRPGVASALMGLLIYFLRPWIEQAGAASLSGLVGKGIKVGAVVALGMSVYFIAAALMGVRPYSEVLQNIRQRVSLKKAVPNEACAVLVASEDAPPIKKLRS